MISNKKYLNQKVKKYIRNLIIFDLLKEKKRINLNLKKKPSSRNFAYWKVEGAKKKKNKLEIKLKKNNCYENKKIYIVLYACLIDYGSWLKNKSWK